MPDPVVTTGTTGEATGTTGAPPADGSATSAGGSESVEERTARLEAALAEEKRKNEQLLSEKTNVENKARDIEAERERLQRQQVSAPQPSTATDPDMEDLAELNATVLKYGENTYEGRAAIREARRIMKNRQLESAFAFRERVDREVKALPAEHREAVRDLMLEGRAQSVAAAYDQVKASTSLNEVESLRKKILELEAKVGGGGGTTQAAPARPNPNVQTAVTSQISAQTHRKVPNLDEFNRIMSAGGPEAKQLQADIDAGRIPDPNFSIPG